MAEGPYSRIYWMLVDDPMFAGIYDSPTLATWLRMLLVADAMYPASAPIGRRTPDVRKLIASGLVLEKSGNRYTMRGLEAERKRRSDAARNAAAVRWQSVRNAEPMPRRDETRQDKTSSSDGLPATFMGFKRQPLRPNLQEIERQHAASFEDAVRKTREREAGK